MDVRQDLRHKIYLKVCENGPLDPFSDLKSD